MRREGGGASLRCCELRTRCCWLDSNEQRASHRLRAFAASEKEATTSGTRVSSTGSKICRGCDSPASCSTSVSRRSLREEREGWELGAREEAAEVGCEKDDGEAEGGKG